ncbi:small acid-soluble spore protein H [Bacillus sp. 03113]|uniref:small acid-soluble spore protein H n=1 Tax=Bacillus sp. 03113 TaxID=2578211 RepID=UPI0011413566|nr:small acid-soluble spore protein H [Bacillus sp. 03113]
MNKQRAKEIASSPIMANVTYNGIPIYIQNVDEKNETAQIYPLNQPDQEQEVSLESLIEQTH